MVDVEFERCARGISQTMLANMVGCTQAYLSMIESGKRSPGVKLAKRLATVFGIEWVEFFKEENAK